MYVREIQPPRATPIENGTPVQGTWTSAFDEVNLLDIQKPYRFPLPRMVLDSRIKEWESIFIQDDSFILVALLCNYKIYRHASVILYDKVKMQRLRFSKTLPGTGWRLPRSLKNAFVDSRSWGFYFRIHSWLDAENIKLDLDIEPNRKRPSFTAHAELILEKEKTIPMAVSLVLNENRSMYAYKTMGPVAGDLVFGGQHISLDPARATGIFCDFKGYYPFPMHPQWCSAVGIDSSDRRIGFAIADNQNREPYKNNENALWIDGRLTPLPPVKITSGTGPEAEWIIQDMEGMVDLVFTPKEPIRYKINQLLPVSFYEIPLGIYNGVVVDSEGEEIPVRNLSGIGEKLFLRI